MRVSTAVGKQEPAAPGDPFQKILRYTNIAQMHLTILFSIPDKRESPMKVKLLTALLTLLASSSLWAQSPAQGTWAFTMNSPFGAVNATVMMEAEGGVLSGEFDLGGGRKLAIENGSIEGDTLTFSITREGMMTMTYEMRATVDDDSIKGVAKAMGSEAPWSMTRTS